MKKRCRRCGERKELIRKFWHVNNDKRSGFASPCKKCRNEYGRRHPETKQNWLKNNKAKRKLATKNYRLRHLDACNEYRKRYRKESDFNKKWCAKNRQTLGDSYVRYMLRLAGFQGELSPTMIQQKREQIMVHRALKQLKEAINE